MFGQGDKLVSRSRSLYDYPDGRGNRMGRAAVAIELTILERQELESLARTIRARRLRGEPVLSLPQPIGMRTKRSVT